MKCFFYDTLRSVGVFVVVLVIKTGFSENSTNTEFGFNFELGTIEFCILIEKSIDHKICVIIEPSL